MLNVEASSSITKKPKDIECSGGPIIFPRLLKAFKKSKKIVEKLNGFSVCVYL